MRLAPVFLLLTCAAPVWTTTEMSACDDSDESIAAQEGEDEGSPPVNLIYKTGGGTQLWTDHLHRGGYRIQQNALTGHWRLLNASNVRVGWGTRAHCESLLDKACPSVEPESPRHVVVLLHGLMRTRGSMKPLEFKLRDDPNVDVIRFSYASTRASIADHAQALRDVLEDMPETSTFSFVGHSMGNIVVRHLLGDLQKSDPSGLLARCHCMVMLGPPNQGALIAKRLARTGVFGLVTGKGAIELGPKWQELEPRLATPPFPFAIIAGDMSHNPIRNPLVDGNSDLIVSVEEAKLEGAEWFKTVPVVHSVLMNDATVQELIRDFLHEHSLAPRKSITWD